MEPLKIFYNAVEAGKQNLWAEVDQLEREYEALEDKLTMDVSWAYLCTCFETLTEASQEDFDLEAKLGKARVSIEVSQHGQSLFTPEEESSRGDSSKEDTEADLQPSNSSPQVNLPPIAISSLDDNLPPEDAPSEL